MSQPDDFLTYKDLWSSLNTWTDDRKKIVFEQVVARLAQFSEESVTNILDGLDAPYKKVVWGIWFRTCDLRKYSLSEMRRLVMDTDASDAAKLWDRWLSQRDLSEINLVAFSKAISDLSPAIQAECLNSFVAKCRNMAIYGVQEWEKVRKTLSSFATKQIVIGATQNKASYSAGDAVKIVGKPYGTRVQSVINTREGWRYWLKDEMRYYSGDEIQKI